MGSKKEKTINFMDLLTEETKKEMLKNTESYDSIEDLKKRIATDPEVHEELKRIAKKMNEEVALLKNKK